jgi:hypothetical protein
MEKRICGEIGGKIKVLDKKKRRNENRVRVVGKEN